MWAQRGPEVPPACLVLDDLGPALDAQLNRLLAIEGSKRHERVSPDLPHLGRAKVSDERNASRCSIETAKNDERVYPNGATAAAKNIRFNQTSLAIDAAIAGQGLALASLFFVQDDIDAGRLARPFATELRVGSDFYLVSLRKPRHPEPITDVRNWLLSAAR